MKLYIATPINARQEPTMREKLISAKHRVEMLKEILADDVQFKDYELISTFDFNNMYDADEEEAMSRCIYLPYNEDPKHYPQIPRLCWEFHFYVQFIIT